jgi:hypothetical protein
MEVGLGFAGVSLLCAVFAKWVPARYGDPERNQYVLRPFFLMLAAVFVTVGFSPPALWGPSSLCAAYLTLLAWACSRSSLVRFAPSSKVRSAVIRRLLMYPVGAIATGSLAGAAVGAGCWWFSGRPNQSDFGLEFYAELSAVMGATICLGVWEEATGHPAAVRRRTSLNVDGRSAPAST